MFQFKSILISLIAFAVAVVLTKFLKRKRDNY